jgi:biopolymer transport protein ExbD
MAGTLGGRGNKTISGINITPMVDVTLVLLVIMMVSATYIVSQSLKVELPKAASASESAVSLAAVTITPDGKYYFNQQPVDEAALVARFKAAAAVSDEVSLIVTADKEAKHGTVVHVIDLAKLEGIRKFAINADTK